MTLPKPQKITDLTIIEPEKTILDNGIELFYINTGSIKVSKLSLIFKSGNWFESKWLTSDLLSQMLNEGTKSKTNKEINELFEGAGNSFSVDQNEDRMEISLSGLSENISKSFDLVFELLTESVFPEKEFKIIKELNVQAIKNRDENVSSLGGLKFVEAIYGKNHPYGYIEDIENLNKVGTDDLKNFFEKCITSENVYIVLAGKFDKNLLDKVNKIFGQDNWKKSYKKEDSKHLITTVDEKKIVLDKKDAVQSAINIGNRSINKTHPDYSKVRLLNNIFGGPSLGSRLMLNIREEKGLTYGIYSEFKSLENDGFFRIKTELKKESVNLAIDEIYKEVKIIKAELISEKELELFRNYLMGMFLQSIDGPFGLMEAFIAIKNYNLDYSYYHNFIKILNTTTVEELRDLANQYYIEDNFKQVIVG